jgi:hypothetical protein
MIHFQIVASYYHYLLSFAARLPKEDAGLLAKLLHWCFYLQIVEIAGLCGISFVHNREHYRKKKTINQFYISVAFVFFDVTIQL